VANIAWLFLWHYEYFALTIVAMVVLLLLLIAIYLRLGTGRTGVSAAETWLVRVPFSIYLGWITVATIANATSLLVAAAVITSAVSLTRGDVAYVLVVVWALIGIAVKHSDTPLVAILAGFLAGWVLGTLLLGVPLTRDRVESRPAGLAEQGARDRW
jgi:benzodiazapine receptor